MKKLIFLTLFLPFVASAITSLQSGVNGYVIVNGVTYPRGFLYPIYTLSGGDTLMQIGVSNGGVLNTPALATTYLLQTGSGSRYFAHMDTLERWINKNFILNSSIEIINIYDSLAASRIALDDSCNSIRLATFQKFDSNTHGNAITLDYFNAHAPTPDSSVFVTHTQLNDTIVKVVKYTDSTIKYATPTQMGVAIHDSLPSLTGYMKYTDTAGMLTPYFRYGGFGLLYSGHTVYADSGSLTTLGTTRRIADSAAGSIVGGYVPTTRTLTINGTAQDLSSNRSWSVGTVTSVNIAAGTGMSVSGSPITTAGTFTVTNTAPDQTVTIAAGTGISVASAYPAFTINATGGTGTVTSVSTTLNSAAAADISLTVNNATTTPQISLNVPTASGTQRGALSSTDWTTFNSKGSGTVTSVTSGFGTTFNPITTSGAVIVDSTIMATKAALRKTEDSLNVNIAAKQATMSAGRGWGLSGASGYLDTSQAYKWYGAATYALSVNTTAVDGISLVSSLTATSGNPKWSPAILLEAQNYNTTSSVTATADYRMYVSGQSSGSPSATFVLTTTQASGTGDVMTALGRAVTFPGNAVTFSNGITCSGGILMGAKISVTTGPNKSVNTAVLSAGTVTVSNTLVTASSRIFVQYASGSALSLGVGNASTGFYVSTVTVGTSFVITAYTAAGIANPTDNSTVEYLIIN